MMRFFRLKQSIIRKKLDERRRTTACAVLDASRENHRQYDSMKYFYTGQLFGTQSEYSWIIVRHANSWIPWLVQRFWVRTNSKPVFLPVFYSPEMISGRQKRMCSVSFSTHLSCTFRAWKCSFQQKKYSDENKYLEIGWSWKKKVF